MSETPLKTSPRMNGKPSTPCSTSNSPSEPLQGGSASAGPPWTDSLPGLLLPSPEPSENRQCWWEHPEWGLCQQVTDALLCRFHAGALDINADPYYHEKIVKGLVQPVSEYLLPAEINATMHGRPKGDGRRFDAYVTGRQRRPWTPGPRLPLRNPQRHSTQRSSQR